MATEDAPQQAQFIGSTEVCERLGIDRGTLTRWIQLGHVKPSGKLPGASGAYLWDPEYIDRVVEARRSEQRAEQWRHLPAYTDPASDRAPGRKDAC